MTHGLEKRSPLLPLSIDVQSVYATLSMGSNGYGGVEKQHTQLDRNRKRYAGRLNGGC